MEGILESPHIFACIGTFLDHKDLKRMSMTSHHFHNMINSDEFLNFQCDTLFQEILEVMNKKIYKHLKFAIDSRYCDDNVKDVMDRLEFLGTTIVDISKYIMSQSKSMSWVKYGRKDVLIILLNSLKKQLYEVYTVLYQINTCIAKITVNFDIFELSLRRIYYDLTTLFPEDPKKYKSNFSSHIRDEISHRVWIIIFGSQCAAVSIDVFFEKIVSTWMVRKDELFEKYFKHLFNFPKDDIITVFRFHTMGCLFGPYPKISENFRKYVMKNNSGFVGLINKVGAEELLRQLVPTLTHNTVLIRFSRLKPELFSFASIDVTTGRVEHSRNDDVNGKSIPIDEYIRRRFTGFEIAHLELDPECVNIKNSATFSKISRYMIHNGYHH